VLSLSLVVYYFVPNTQTHIQIILDSFSSENHNPDSVESTQLRIHAWQASKSVMEEHILLGHGTGDVWDMLSNEYKKQGYNGALLKEVNAHNEFYQTGLAIGLVGIVYLILMFAVLVVVAVRKRHFPLLLWTLITAIAFFFESYFSTQDGVIYTSLFLFFVVFLKNDRHE
jgi:O-antigen ligase